MRSSLRFTSILTAFSFVLLVAAGAALAGGAKDQPARPRSGSVSKQVTRSGPAGAERTWSQQRSWERRDGSYQSQTSRTGPGGRTRTRDVDAVRTDAGSERHTTWTDAQGRQAHRDAEVTVDRESGTATRDVVFSGRDGQTSTRHDELIRTEDGHTSSSTLTRRDGSVVDREASVSRDPEAGSKQKDVVWTDAEGHTVTRSSERVRTEDGYTRTTTVTGPDGQSATWEKTVTRDASEGDKPVD